VISRLGNRLRAAGTAELTGYDTTVSPVRCAAIARRVVSLFPALRSVLAYESWAGLRPATPANVPIVGRTRLSNLFLNTGHGTLGWTLACGSGAALADLVRRPAPAGRVRVPALRESESLFLAIRGLRYHVRRWPAPSARPGAPKMFLLHGWMDVSASFQFVVDALRGPWDVYAPDWRGYGSPNGESRIRTGFPTTLRIWITSWSAFPLRMLSIW
jgi:hypothetical protein